MYTYIYRHLSCFFEFSVKLPNLAGQISPIQCFSWEQVRSHRATGGSSHTEPPKRRSWEVAFPLQQRDDSTREVQGNWDHVVTLGIADMVDVCLVAYTHWKKTHGGMWVHKCAAIVIHSGRTSPIQGWKNWLYVGPIHWSLRYSLFQPKGVFVSKTTMVEVRQNTCMSTRFHQ